MHIELLPENISDILVLLNSIEEYLLENKIHNYTLADVLKLSSKIYLIENLVNNLEDNLS